MLVMGMGEKPRNKRKTREKKSEADCFPGRKEPKTSRTCPKWDWDPNLRG